MTEDKDSIGAFVEALIKERFAAAVAGCGKESLSGRISHERINYCGYSASTDPVNHSCPYLNREVIGEGTDTTLGLIKLKVKVYGCSAQSR